MSEIKTLSEVMQQQQEYRQNAKIARAWRSIRPKGSRWNPGDPGDPACGVCEGTGYLRLDLPIGHPQYGRLVLCDCVRVLEVK